MLHVASESETQHTRSSSQTPRAGRLLNKLRRDSGHRQILWDSQTRQEIRSGPPAALSAPRSPFPGCVIRSEVRGWHLPDRIKRLDAAITKCFRAYTDELGMPMIEFTERPDWLKSGDVVVTARLLDRSRDLSPRSYVFRTFALEEYLAEHPIPPAVKALIAEHTPIEHRPCDWRVIMEPVYVGWWPLRYYPANQNELDLKRPRTVDPLLVGRINEVPWYGLILAHWD